MTPRAPTIMGSSGGLGVNWTLATLLAALVLSVFVICGVHNKKRHRFKEKGLKTKQSIISSKKQQGKSKAEIKVKTKSLKAEKNKLVSEIPKAKSVKKFKRRLLLQRQ